MISNIKDRSLTIGEILGLSELGLDGPFDMSKIGDMPISSFTGGEEGFNQKFDVITQTKDGFPLNGMWSEFQKTINMWNAQRDALSNILTFKVTNLIEGVRYPIEQDFEEMSEFGQPKGIRLGPAFRMGYDFKWWDLAIRYTWMFLLDATKAQLQALNNTALEADNRLMFQRIMKQVFNNTTKVADIDGESVNVYPFYNGDAMVPPKWKNTTFTAPHTHYLSSGAGTVNSGDLDEMQLHLTHHGYSQIKGYRLVLFVSEQEGATIRGFTRATGAKYDFIPNQNVGGGMYIAPNGGIIGAPTLANIPGLVTIGSYGSMTVIEESYIPTGYMLATASGGENNIGNPVGIREHENTSARGLMLIKGNDATYPLVDSFYQHGFGTGIRHRGAGVVMKITAGAWAPPTEYA